MQLVKAIPLVSMHDHCPLMSPAGVEDLSLKDHAQRLMFHGIYQPRWIGTY